MDEHICGQGGTLGIICTKIEEIQKDLVEIKSDQKVYLSNSQKADIDRAKYPPPELVGKKVSQLDRHETYFKIIWVLLGCAWGLLLVVAAVVLPKLLL